MILLSCQNYNRFPRPGKNILILKKNTSLTPIIKDDARAERKQNMLFSKSDHYNCCNIAGLENTQEFENTTIKNV